MSTHVKSSIYLYTIYSELSVLIIIIQLFNLPKENAT